jgi:ATP-binding cassette subfamily B protein
VSEYYKEGGKTVAIFDPSIEFKNISFKYEGSENVLNDVSFKILPHEKVALVGHSGAGKSTIVNLIMKLYTPTAGDIFLKDKKYSSLSHKSVRDNISLVFQENELFSSTIRENVAYSKPDATDKEIISALKSANAYDFVLKFPKGLDSEIGERGVRLSGGQKQRIQIARAILRNAPILILDEATSSLDAKSEFEVQQALEVLMKNRLTIIIAHRFSTIQNVDKIIVIEDGMISNYGTPQELSSQKGLYAELLKYQIDGNQKLLDQFGLH